MNCAPAAAPESAAARHGSAKPKAGAAPALDIQRTLK
jgi:hypothetical protein